MKNHPIQLDSLEPRRLCAVDLIVSVTTNGTTVAAPDDRLPAIFDAEVTIRNIGSTQALGTFTGDLYISKNQAIGSDDHKVGTFTTAPNATLNAGQSIKVNASLGRDIGASATAGEYFLIAVVDPQNQIFETNDNNNTNTTSAPVVAVTTTKQPPSITGTGGNDVIILNATAKNLLVTFNGLNTYIELDEDSVIPINAGSGNDKVIATGDVAVKLSVTGAGGNDTIQGGSGDDELSGANGKDRILGGAGNDYLLGGASNDYLNGQLGNDTLSGAGGKDRLFGDYGKDYLLGGASNDYLDAVTVSSTAQDTEADTLSGNAGTDTGLYDADEDVSAGIEIAQTI
ncbi:MAG: CARDB domain-containing protein [Tepidisphaeraceae bacterium]